MTARLAPTITARLASLAIALLATLAMLAGVDHLATADGAAPQLVQAMATPRA